MLYKDNLVAISLTKNQQVMTCNKHMVFRHHYMQGLLADNHLDICFQPSLNKSSDITTKNTLREIQERHTEKLQTGTRHCWKADVNTDDSIQMFDNYRMESYK
jgi:hypothetical protein